MTYLDQSPFAEMTRVHHGPANSAVFKASFEMTSGSTANIPRTAWLTMACTHVLCRLDERHLSEAFETLVTTWEDQEHSAKLSTIAASQAVTGVRKHASPGKKSTASPILLGE